MCFVIFDARKFYIVLNWEQEKLGFYIFLHAYRDTPKLPALSQKKERLTDHEMRLSYKFIFAKFTRLYKV